MNENLSRICVDKTIFTIEDAAKAAEQIFESQEADFYKLKNEAWYKHLINAITFDSYRKKAIVKDIRSLSKLQIIFLQIYLQNYKESVHRKKLNDYQILTR